MAAGSVRRLAGDSGRANLWDEEKAEWKKLFKATQALSEHPSGLLDRTGSPGEMKAEAVRGGVEGVTQLRTQLAGARSIACMRFFIVSISGSRAGGLINWLK